MVSAYEKWEKRIVKYMVGLGIPGFAWDAGKRRFYGLKGFSLVRITPKPAGGWSRVPTWFTRYEDERSQGSPHPVVMMITSSHNGPSIQDSYVLMRLETFGDLIKPLVEADPGRYLGME